MKRTLDAGEEQFWLSCTPFYFLVVVILVICCGYSSALSIWLLILKVSFKGFSGMTLLPIPLRDPSKDAQQHHGMERILALSGRILRCAPGSDQLWSSQKASGLWVTPCNSRITQKWQQIQTRLNTKHNLISLWTFFWCNLFQGILDRVEYKNQERQKTREQV